MSRPAVDPLAPHHDGSPLYCGTIRPALGETVPVWVRVPHRSDGSPGAERVVLRVVRDGEPAISAAVPDGPHHAAGTDPYAAWWRAEVCVHNPLTSYRFALTDPSGDLRWLNAEGVHARDVSDAADFKLSAEHRLPDWVLDQVGYQIFPDRFARTETGVAPPAWAQPADWDDPVVHRGPEVPFQLYGGTLDGIADHLDHVTELGATLLYLTPVFEAWSNHRYDAVSFDHVDPVLGGDAALERLVAATHAAGLRIMGDLTTNHTGEHHAWFTTALADPTAPERDFYTIRADGSYECWWDIPSLPKLDHRSAELARRLYAGADSIAARWLRAGLDGWRIDVANMTARSGPVDLAHSVARQLRATIEEVGPEAWLLAEHGHDATLDLTGPGWHGTMDYAGFTRPVWCWLNGGSTARRLEPPGIPHDLTYLGLPIDIPVLPGSAVVATMREFHAALPWAAQQGSTLHLDSHDVPRFRTVAGGGIDGWIDAAGRGRDRHLAGLAIQMTMPGVPVVFMGDELGLTGLDGEHARTPMPWRRRSDWDEQTLPAYRFWIGLRRTHVALRRGGLRWLHAGDDALTYVREHPEETVLVHVTRQAAAPVRLPRAALGRVNSIEAVAGEPAHLDDREIALPGAGVHVSVLR